ncbi:MAG: hypothetical protein IJ354_00560 [Clostridia bacterium]|nr:hypothetical protein [Clostridia bacterium]
MSTIRQTLMLRPMHNGVSGYARIQHENRHTVVQLHARGLPPGTARLYWLTHDRLAREAASAAVGDHGDCSIEAWTPEASGPGRLQALLLITGDDHPRPLMVGLCADQSAGSILDAKSAALDLCAQLGRHNGKEETVQKAEPVPVAEAEPEPQPEPLPKDEPVTDPPAEPEMMPVVEEPEPRQETSVPVQRKGAKPPLRWPRGFDSLKRYFDGALPCRILDLPGWRFVYAANAGGPEGLWVGRQILDGHVRGVAYVTRGSAPPGPGPFRTARGVDGLLYQVLWQRL